jgi:hypothetical protein
MDGLQSSTESILGFLAIRQREPHGFFGGYLVVNSRARPLEFHCTLPVQPTRAQQILYGATLTEYICGELIARTLLGKAAAKPKLVLTDCHASLAVRHWMDQPLLHVAPDSLRNPDSLRTTEGRAMDDIEGFIIPEMNARDSRYTSQQRHNATFSCITTYGRDMDVLGCLEEFEGNLDLLEPFSRIVEALAEAHPRSRAA